MTGIEKGRRRYLFAGLEELTEELISFEVAVGEIVFDLLLDFGLVDAHCV